MNREERKKAARDNKNFYVYLHRKKSDGTVFYVGKGKGNRAWVTDGRSKHWNNTVNKHGFVVELFEENIQEWYAYELEEEQVLKYGRVDNNTGILVNFTNGGVGAPSTVVSKETREKLSKALKIAPNKRRSSVIYNLKNIFTGEELQCTKRDFYLKTGSTLSTLLRKQNIHTKGWYIVDLVTDFQVQSVLYKKTGEYSKTADKTIYEFTRLSSDEVFTGTRSEFYDKTGLKPTSIFSSRASKSVGDWRLSSTQVTKKFDLCVYTFINKDTEESFTGLRRDFKYKYGFHLKKLFEDPPHSHCKGWTLVK